MLGPKPARLGPAVGLTLASSVLALTATAAPPAAPELSVSGDAGAGHLTLAWSADPLGAGGAFILEEADRADFSDARERYRGRAQGTVISGLPDGERHYRVRAIGGGELGGEPGPWSKPVHFKVSHHGLDLALTLLGLGGLVFFALVGYLLTATRRLAAERTTA